MRFDCGATSTDPYSDPRHEAVFGGWPRQELEPLIAHELMILVHTPGIPIEWVYGMFKLNYRWRTRLGEMIHAVDTARYEALGKANAATVEEDDGWRMLINLGRVHEYVGPVPLYTQMALQQAKGSDAAIAKILKVDRQTLRRWRVNQIFCPVTSVRLVGRRGYPAGRPRKATRVL